jgi:hypothetical protein
MKRTLERWTRRLGTTGVLAVGLLVFNAAVLINGVLPLRERQLHAESRTRAAAVPGGMAVPVAAARDPVRGFYAFFATRDHVPDVLAQLHDAAARQGLELAQAEYRLEPGAAGLVGYRIVTSVRGSYPRVRAFLMAALNGTPQLALESIRFERQKARDEQVETQLRFTLYLRTQER